LVAAVFGPNNTVHWKPKNRNFDDDKLAISLIPDDNDNFRLMFKANGVVALSYNAMSDKVIWNGLLIEPSNITRGHFLCMYKKGKKKFIKNLHDSINYYCKCYPKSYTWQEYF